MNSQYKNNTIELITMLINDVIHYGYYINDEYIMTPVFTYKFMAISSAKKEINDKLFWNK